MMESIPYLISGSAVFLYLRMLWHGPGHHKKRPDDDA